MNEYDSQKIAKILEGGYSTCTDPEEADLVIVNTCSVRDKPEQKLYSFLGEMNELKQIRPKLMVGVGGCVAQQEGEKIVKRSKAVDFVFGTHNLSLVPSLIERRRGGSKPQVAVNYRDEWEELPLGLSGDSKVSVFVSISRGCNKNCTYCIVPTTRGPEVSRDPAEIEREVKIAVHRGAREIVLLGQTVNSYGLDLEPRLKFAGLLERISAIEGLKRIRFTSPHPQEVRQDFIDLVAENPKICRHIHMPLQSGSDSMLRAMNRNYRREKYMKIIEDLRRRVPEIAFTTDIIVGFPGETEEDVEQTLQVMREVGYDNSYSFMFSPRPGTPAAQLEETVSPEEKLERLQRVQSLQDSMTTAALQRWVGKDVEVLFEDTDREDPTKLRGRISQNLMLNLLEPAPHLRPGDLAQVAVIESGRYTLRGRAVPVGNLAVNSSFPGNS